MSFGSPSAQRLRIESQVLVRHSKVREYCRIIEHVHKIESNRIASHRIESSRVENFKFRLKCLAPNGNNRKNDASWLSFTLLAACLLFNFRAEAENGNKSCPKWAHKVPLASFTGASTASAAEVL